MPRLRAIMQRQNPFLEGIDTDSWAEERQYRSQDGQASFRSFCATRLNLVGLLESLQASDWQRNATHSILGPIQLFELVKIIASHDRLHIQQISKNNKGK